MKIPSTIKLVGVLTDKRFEIRRKNKDEDGPLIKVMYSQNISYHIIRHSTTGLILRDKVPASKDSYYLNEVQISLESSY